VEGLDSHHSNDFLCINILFCTVDTHGDGAGVWFLRNGFSEIGFIIL
jgi:hypothetical protein